MPREFDPTGEIYQLKNARCKEIFKTKSGSQAVKFVFEGGSKTLFDEDVAKRAHVDTRYNITANITYGKEGQMYLDAVQLEPADGGESPSRRTRATAGAGA